MVDKNFVSLLEETARKHPEKTAICCDDATLSYRELYERAAGVARSLAHKGVGQGDRVMLLLPNHWSFVVGVLGVWKLGATVVPLSPMLKGDEEQTIVSDVQPAQVVKSIELDPGDGQSVTEGGAPALIAYSSGSTGKPKGAVISHAALTFACQSWADLMAVSPDDVVLSVLPLPHAYGFHGSLLAPLQRGAQIVILDRFSPAAVLAAIPEHRITLFLGVATMYRRLLSSPDLDGTDLSSVRLCVSGAAPCPWELAEQWRERTGKRILRGYGMTELFRPISYLAYESEDRPESIGRAVPGVLARIVPVQGGEAHSGAPMGELWIKSPAALDGYWNDELETRAVLVDGWFRTGDLARISTDGFIEIVGRVKERILRGGYSVFPQEVEAVLLTHGGIAEVAVLGVPDADLEEEVAAFVVLKQGFLATAEEIVEFCGKRLARFKYPRHVYFIDELPKGNTGKVLKAELIRRWSANQLRDGR